MAKAYTYLYAVENSIRLFIEHVCKQAFGGDYFEKITVPKALQKNIQDRKKKSKENKWLSPRGESELFYLDFKDLNTLITNNWDIFKGYLPNQNYLTSKLEEMAECRNLIAHNSMISRDEINLIKVYYNSILKQIAGVLKSE